MHLLLLTAVAALFCSTTTSAQYSGASSTALRAVPFQRLKLVVERPLDDDLAQLLDSALRAEWTLTPQYELVDPETFFQARSDTNVILLELIRTTWVIHRDPAQGTMTRVVPHHGPGIHASYQSHAETRRMPISTGGTTSSGSNLEREPFAIAEAMVGRQQKDHSFQSTFNTHTVPNDDIRDGHAVLTRGRPDKDVRSGKPAPVKEEDFLALAPMDMHGAEQYGVHDQYRLRMILRGLQDGVAFVRAQRFAGPAKACITAQEGAYRQRLKRLKGRSLLLPDGWLLPTQRDLFTARFQGRLRVAEASEIAQAITSRDSIQAIVLPLGRKLHFFDPATMEPIYVHEIKWLEAPQLDTLERLWLKNEK